MKKEIENNVWKVKMVNNKEFQYVVVTRQSDGKEIMCYSNGNFTTTIKPRGEKHELES